jgi:hypothetical protein
VALGAWRVAAVRGARRGWPRTPAPLPPTVARADQNAGAPNRATAAPGPSPGHDERPAANALLASCAPRPRAHRSRPVRAEATAGLPRKADGAPPPTHRPHNKTSFLRARPATRRGSNARESYRARRPGHAGGRIAARAGALRAEVASRPRGALPSSKGRSEYPFARFMPMVHPARRRNQNAHPSSRSGRYARLGSAGPAMRRG